MNSLYVRGVRDGIPVALGYIPVSIGFGIMAVGSGLPISVAMLISMTNLTSAGQVAGVTVLAAGGGMVEMAFTQLVINIRYALMSLTLSQKLSRSFTTLHRLLASFGITDEIFAIAAAYPQDLTPAYFYGLVTLPYLGWASGTLIGALLGNILPTVIRDSLGIAIYGMFLAIVLPPAKKRRAIRTASLSAAALSILFTYLPIFSFLSSGFSVIISAVLAAAIAAAIFPSPDESPDAVESEPKSEELS